LSPADADVKVHTEQQKWNEMKAVCFGLAFISVHFSVALYAALVTFNEHTEWRN